MIICHCRHITDRDVRAQACRGGSARDVFCCTKGHASCCGSCGATIRAMLSELSSTEAAAVPGSDSE